MSTYMYLECHSHTPPLCAEHESGQHYYDLPQIRDDLAARKELVEAARQNLWADDYFRRPTQAFLVAHPDCEIRIVDEYGIDHTEPEDDE